MAFARGGSHGVASLFASEGLDSRFSSEGRRSFDLFRPAPLVRQASPDLSRPAPLVRQASPDLSRPAPLVRQASPRRASVVSKESQEAGSSVVRRRPAAELPVTESEYLTWLHGSDDFEGQMTRSMIAKDDVKDGNSAYRSDTTLGKGSQYFSQLSTTPSTGIPGSFERYSTPDCLLGGADVSDSESDNDPETKWVLSMESKGDMSRSRWMRAKTWTKTRSISRSVRVALQRLTKSGPASHTTFENTPPSRNSSRGRLQDRSSPIRIPSHIQIDHTSTNKQMNFKADEVFMTWEAEC